MVLSVSAAPFYNPLILIVLFRCSKIESFLPDSIETMSGTCFSSYASFFILKCHTIIFQTTIFIKFLYFTFLGSFAVCLVSLATAVVEVVSSTILVYSFSEFE